MPRWVGLRLSIMMFLFYFAVGSWVVTLSTFLMTSPFRGGLSFSTSEVGWIYSTFAIGGILAPFTIGLLADRLFHTERVLTVCGLLGAVLLGVAGVWCDQQYPKIEAAYYDALFAELPTDEQQRLIHGREWATSPNYAGLYASLSADQIRQYSDAAHNNPNVRQLVRQSFVPLFGLMLAQCFCVQICMTLTNVIAFRNLPDPAARFSRCRLWGTVGWIAAGNALGLFLTPVSSDPLYLACVSSALFGLFCLVLPPTPPRAQGRSLAEAVGLPALKLFKQRSFLVFCVVALMAAGLNQFYAVYAHRFLTDLGIRRPEQVMTLGQLTEVGVMFLLPLLHPRKWTKVFMAVGLLGYAVRSIAMYSEWIPLVITFGVTMHGWSYALFYVVAATYIDRQAPPHLRASTQAIVSFVMAGVAPWLGNLFAAQVVDHYRAGSLIDWQPVWLVPLVGSSLALLIFLVGFRIPPERDEPTPPAQPT